MESVTLGEYIRRKRRESGMRCVEFASRLGVTYETVYYWERNLRYPNDCRIADLCNALALDFSEVLMVKIRDQQRRSTRGK